MEIDEILTFWFGSHLDDAKVAGEKSALWWSKNPDMDLEIARRFGYYSTAPARTNCRSGRQILAVGWL